MSTIYGILLQTNGEVKKIKLKETKNQEPLTTDILQKIIKKKTPLTLLGGYDCETYNLTLFGYKTGKTGTENKHELPPPLNSDTYFSDILVIASKTVWTTPMNFTPEQYEKFYQSVFGENEDDDEEEEEEENEEDDTLEEEEEEEEHTKLSSKKKAAEEDGVPEDEEDKEAEESDEDSEEDAEEDGEEDEENALEDIMEEMGGGDEEEEPLPTKVKTSSKKKSTKSNLSIAQNTGRAKQHALKMRADFTPITEITPIPTVSGNEKKYREHVLMQIKTKLETLFTEDEQKQIETCILTSALADADIKFVVKHFDNKLFQICYMSSARRLLSNLDTTSYVKNTSLITKIKAGDLDISHLASMNSMDYAPTLYTGLRERQVLREQQQLEGNKSMATDMFKCGRCHKRETTFYELQTRSADEPMTKFINCLNCGNHWKQ
jgi:DNA-directed RNA polymerase subunit M/transcription elongation factor TFIIS